MCGSNLFVLISSFISFRKKTPSNFHYFRYFFAFFPKFHCFLHLVTLFKSGDMSEFSFRETKITFLAGNEHHDRAAPATHSGNWTCPLKWD